jgi:branched-chain amino acid transport system permease protein
LIAAILVATGIATFLGLITFRVQGFVFSLVTYAAAVVCLNVAHNWEFLGASDGIVGIPPLDLSIGPLTLKAADNRSIWPFAYMLLIGTIFFVNRFRRSIIGRSALMVHLNHRLATMSGIAPSQIRFRVLLLSAIVTSLGGWLYSYQRAYVGPDLFETYFLTLMLTAAVLPGKRVLLGPLIGTALLMTQKAFFSFGGYFDKIVLGTVLIVVLALYPRGLLGLYEAISSRLSYKSGVSAPKLNQP